MNTRKIPALIMLCAGSVACVMMYFNHYNLKDMLIVLIFVLVIFLFIGMVVKGILDSIHLPSEDAVGPDGEVIEKKEEEQTEGEEGDHAEAGEGENPSETEAGNSPQ